MGHRAHSKGLGHSSDPGVVDEQQSDFVAAFARGIRVIRAFGDNSQMLTLTQVAERSELTPAGARRLLLTLVTLGYAGVKGRYYYLMPKVLALGYAYLTSLPIYHFAQPILEELAEKTGETCAVCVLDDMETMFALRITLKRIIGGDSGIGARRPAHATSMGRVLLGGLSEAALAEYFSRADLRAFTAKTITSPEKLRLEIQKDRLRGFSWVSGELEENASGLSVPIKDPQGDIIAALNVSFNRAKISKASVVKDDLPLLNAAADQIQRTLSFRQGAMADLQSR